jgi:hypothetical protein
MVTMTMHHRARRAGLDEESIEALYMTSFRTAAEEDRA